MFPGGVICTIYISFTEDKGLKFLGNTSVLIPNSVGKKDLYRMICLMGLTERVPTILKHHFTTDHCRGQRKFQICSNILQFYKQIQRVGVNFDFVCNEDINPPMNVTSLVGLTGFLPID